MPETDGLAASKKPGDFSDERPSDDAKAAREAEWKQAGQPAQVTKKDVEAAKRDPKSVVPHGDMGAVEGPSS